MPNIIVIGTQWGDEGKGKIVDYLSGQADAIIRFQGGHNAGHTLVINNQTFKLSLLPSGIVRENKLCVIGNGVVLNPWVLIEEIAKVQACGVHVSPENLALLDNTCLILPLHALIDQAREVAKGSGKIGTTGRGIGPAYEDKVARRAIRVCDLFDSEILENKVNQLLEHHNIYLRNFRIAEIEPRKLLEDLREIAKLIQPYIRKSFQFLSKLADRNLLFEGAQGVMLDVDFGTYPFVSSSNTVASNAWIGSGLGQGFCKSETQVIGVAKAYTTRVGAGPFPTKIVGEAAQIIGERGHEFGTVTGRKRDCGWFDILQMRYAIQVSGVQSLILTKLDVLDILTEIPVCVGYRLENKRLSEFPLSQTEQAKVVPIYENLPGWQTKTYGLRSWDALPEAAKAYVKKLEHWLMVPIIGVSTSPEREDVVMREAYSI